MAIFVTFTTPKTKHSPNISHPTIQLPSLRKLFLKWPIQPCYRCFLRTRRHQFSYQGLSGKQKWVPNEAVFNKGTQKNVIPIATKMKVPPYRNFCYKCVASLVLTWYLQISCSLGTHGPSQNVWGKVCWIVSLWFQDHGHFYIKQLVFSDGIPTLTLTRWPCQP